MSAPDDNRLAELRRRIEETQAAVDLQRTLVLELQRKEKNAAEERRILLRYIEILTLHQEELDRIMQESEA
jgi:hypothetical protein